MSLATKYRPKTWEDVTEQGLVIQMLKSMCESELSNRCFLLTGPAGTGKTSTGRLIATYLNGSIDNLIEIDAASNNGVDAMRDLVQQASTYPIGTNYKIMLVDECVTGDVEVLTDSGFKRFDNCDGTELVAQYDNGSICFVNPISWVNKHYDGDLIKWKPRDWCSVRMTPNHVQPLYYLKSKKIKEKYIQDVKFGPQNSLVVSGCGTGTKSSLTAMDRIAIACQADGTIQHVNSDYIHWSIAFKKQRKVDRFLSLVSECSIDCKEINSNMEGYRRFVFNTPLSITKQFNTHFNLDMSYECAREFINEVVMWDGYITEQYKEYMSVNKFNSDFVSAVAPLGGYSARVRVQTDNRSDSFSDVYKVFLYDTNYVTCQAISKPGKVVHEHYEGNVYCVNVPSHQIVIRSEGFIFITGNCHVLTPPAWQVLLKTFEEQPAKTVFILCTTNPEKIPPTILSRVQTFQLSKISLEGIKNRLKFVMDSEIAEGQKYTYTDDAILYIAKLSNGGMRDSLTLLEKSIAYSHNVTTENVVKALNLPNYDDYFKLLGAYAKKDNSKITEIIDFVYNSGVNFQKWFEGFHSFVMNVVKYIFLQDIQKTMIPSYYESKISKYNVNHVIVCLKLANKLVDLNNALKTTQYLQETALTYLCSIPKKDVNV